MVVASEPLNSTCWWDNVEYVIWPPPLWLPWKAVCYVRAMGSRCALSLETTESLS